MLAAGTIRRWRVLVVVVTVLAGAALATACEPQSDAQPPVAPVDFEPRLIVTVADGGISGEPGPRDGAEIVHDSDTLDWIVPAGSVVEVHNDATRPRRFVITRGSATSVGTPTYPAASEADVWLDTGEMAPGDTVVLGLSAVGAYGFDPMTDDEPGAPEFGIRVAPRPAA
jgi:nitrous oxide reductase accessory protein NosL